MSRQSVGPSVNVQGRSREAREHYQKVLGGTLDLQAAGPQGGPKPARPGDRIMTPRLEADGVVIAGTDGRPDYPPTTGDNTAIAVGGTDRDWLAKIFTPLADCGKTKMPLPAGPGAGWLTDTFGINWMVSIDKA